MSGPRIRFSPAYGGTSNQRAAGFSAHSLSARIRKAQNYRYG